MKVMSFNLRFGTANDGKNSWPHRQHLVQAIVDRYRPDILGVQEALAMQMDYLQAAFPGYASLGVGREDGRFEGEFAGIFYQAEMYTLVEHGHFWLSETPSVPGSLGWDANNVRICTWGHFRDNATGTRFTVLNTHLDHMGQQAQAEGSRLIYQRVQEISPQMPVILTGDFNCTPDSTPYRCITGSDTGFVDTRNVAAQVTGPTWTFHGFQPPGQDRIDYIFVRGISKVHSYAALADNWQGQYPSDHLPLLVQLQL